MDVVLNTGNSINELEISFNVRRQFQILLAI